MTYAAITGWGKCMPPSVLSNADLSTFLDTTDDWIVTRTGMRERRISHVPAIEMATVAARRALACAGLEADDLDLIVYGSCSNDEQVPNSASGVQVSLGARHAAAMDVNTACTSFLYGLSTASALIRTGAARTALVVGVELISPYMDWDNRNVAVLFGDGCAAVVLQATDRQEGVLGEQLGCNAEARHTLRVRGMGCAYANRDVMFGDTQWDFDGQEIFRHAVQGMTQAQRRSAGALRHRAGRRRPRRAAPGKPADHRRRRLAHGHPDGQGDADGAALRQHERRHGARRAGRRARGRPRRAARD